jgi:cytoskeletal protein CcmA (bactofilin family)
MWRKPTDAKPTDTKATETKPSTQRPETPAAAPVPAAPVTARVEPAPVVAAIPVPAPAAVPSKPAYTAPARKAVTTDNSTGTVIGQGLKIRGEVSGSSDLYIDGDVQGKINLSDARVTVGANGHVQADIEAREIGIEGTVDGNLKARDSVRLGATSKVQGSILTPRIGIEDGARLRGKVEMTRDNETKPSKSSGSSTGATSQAAVPAYNAVSATAERK